MEQIKTKGLFRLRENLLKKPLILVTLPLNLGMETKWSSTDGEKEIEVKDANFVREFV